MSTGAVVAAARRRAERRLIEFLRAAGAVDSASACPLPESRGMAGRVLRRLIAAGAIREANARYFLDEGVYSAYRSRRRRIGMFIVGFLITVALIVGGVAFVLRG